MMSRGDRREEIFRDNADRNRFLETLGRACGKTGWQVHAYCLMTNHFHLVMETPRANLVDGMKWLLGTYTMWFNRRHKLTGHLFAGRYKSLLIDESSRGYLRAVCDYVHLNRSGENGGQSTNLDRVEIRFKASGKFRLFLAAKPAYLLTDIGCAAHRQPIGDPTLACERLPQKQVG